jgi:valyl-tRNA synthetase
VDATRLAGPALEAVADGRIEIVRDQRRKTWISGWRNIQPWCVSRSCGGGTASRRGTPTMGGVRGGERAAAHAKRNVPLRQDEDVLDTWFSSALWPFATLGWPDDMER